MVFPVHTAATKNSWRECLDFMILSRYRKEVQLLERLDIGVHRWNVQRIFKMVWILMGGGRKQPPCFSCYFLPGLLQ